MPKQLVSIELLYKQTQTYPLIAYRKLRTHNMVSAVLSLSQVWSIVCLIHAHYYRFLFGSLKKKETTLIHAATPTDRQHKYEMKNITRK
jgi:hypothetical protein